MTKEPAMSGPKDAVYMVSAIASLMMGVAITAFFVMAFMCPVLFRLGTVAERFNYLTCNLEIFTLARHITFAWIFVEIPVGIGLYYLVREQNPGRARFGATFWFIGVFGQFVAYSLMFNLIQRLYAGQLSAPIFMTIDNVSFGLEMTSVMFLCAAILVFGSVLIRDRGLVKLTGWLLMVIALCCMAGALLINLDLVMHAPHFIYNMGMLFYAGAGVVIAIFTCVLLFVIFRNKALASRTSE